METRNYVTDLPNQINKQIQQNTQKYDVNTGGVREVLNEGVNPIPLTELGSTFDQMVAPSAPSIRYSKAYIEGKPAITLVIDFSGRDELGLEINDDIRCDIFRDENNDGSFSDDECLQQLDLRKVNNYTDKTAPANKIVRYRCLVKNMRNGLQQWSQPLVINTADTVTPYTPVSPLSITNGASTIDEKNNIVTTMLKIEKHVSEYLKHMELYYKQKDQAEWSQAIILDEKTATKEEVVEGVTVDYYIYYLSGLSRGQLYSVKVKAIMKTGTESEFSAVHDFTAGDFVAPNPPRNVKSVNLCSTTSLKIQTTWDRALEVFDERDVVKYQIVRWQYNSAAGAYVNPTNPLYEYPDLIAEVIVDQNDLDKEKYTYEHTLDSADENKYYTYGVRSVDSFGNYSAYVYGELVQAIVEIDSALTWIVWQANNENNFPMRVIWKYEPTIPSGQMLVNHGIEFIRNSDNARIAFFQVANDPTKKITHEGNTGCSYIDISIDMFGIEAVKEFLAIPNWQIDHNYAVRIAGSFMDIGGSLKRFSMQDGEETFLINPRPSAVTGFSGIYSNVDHQVKFKWAKNTFASLTGYVLKQITEADYTSLLAHPADTAEDRAIRLGIWNNGTIIADDKVLKKDVTTYNYKLTEALNPASPVELFFLIKPVGNFLNTEKYSDINTRKIYSDEAASTTTILSSILPAPTNYTALMYNAEMKVDWTHEYELTGYDEIAKTKLKEFVVYMSQTASDLAADLPLDKFKVYSGVKSVCVFRDYIDPSNPPNLISVQRGQTYYFKIIPFDSFGYRGVSTPIFQNTVLAAPTALPKPRIIGNSKQRFISLPFADTSWGKSGTISVDVYNNRNFQVEIPEFAKDRNVDRIKFYWLINKTFTYIEGMDLLLALSSAEISQSMTMKAQRKSFALPTDKTLFQIVAVQARGDVEEGSLVSALPTNYSIVDTQVPSLDITKIVYVTDSTNAINKNNYINKKVLDGGIDIYFNAYEKEPNSQIQKVEYSLTEGSWTTATLSDGKFRVTNAQLGDDKDSNGKYRDIQILIRAFDNADNTCDRAIVFRKDTVGPVAADLPTSLTWAFGRDVKLTWINPAVQDRNLFDGLKLFIGGMLETAKEYTLDTNPFVFRPSVNPGNNAIELYLAAFDIADNYTYLNKAGEVQSGPTKIEIYNYPPAAPTDVKVETQVGGVLATWPAVTTDTQGNAEEVEKYEVQYAISETTPVSGWTSPTNNITYTTNIPISLSAAEMDQFAANTSLRLYVKVKAYDYWNKDGAYSDFTSSYARPKNITAVDMGNNIFKFKLSSDMTLTPYVGVDPSGTSEHILDANYKDTEYVKFTVSNSTNNYIKVDFNKVEWISDIKLKFKHSTTVRFVIKLEEISGATTQDVWLQSVNSSNHTFNEAGEVVISYTKPDPERYFEYTTTDASIGDMALFHYENFSTGKAILAKSVSIYFYNTGTYDMVEFQPVVTSIANIFYGSEINLDNLVSIRSKADAANYSVLNKESLTFYTTGAVITTQIGKIETGVYGAWFPKCYVGGSAYNNAPLYIDANGRLVINSTAYSSSGTINITQIDAGSGGGSFALCYGATIYGNWNFGYRVDAIGSDDDTQIGYYVSSSGDRGLGTFSGVGIGSTATDANTKNYHIYISSVRDDGHSNENERIIDYRLYTNAVGYCYYKISAWHDGIEIYTNQYLSETATKFQWQCSSGSAWLNTSGNLTIGSLADYASTTWKLYALGAIKHTGALEQEQVTPTITLKNTTAYNIQTSTSGCTLIDFHNKYTSGGTSASQAQIVAWRYNYPFAPYAESPWTRLTFRILNYLGAWVEPLMIDYSGINISGSIYASGVLQANSVYGGYISASIESQASGTYPIFKAFSSYAYNGGTYGYYMFSGYVDSSYNAANFSAIIGGKSNTTNADYKGYLKLCTSYSSSYLLMTRVIVNAGGQVSIGNNSGALATTNTGDIAGATNAALGIACDADSGISYGIYAKGYSSNYAIYGTVAGAGVAVMGDNTSSGNGVYGLSSSGNGVKGVSSTGVGVYGQATGGIQAGGFFTGATYALGTNGSVYMINLATSSSGGSSYPIYIDGNNILWKNTSSIKYKTDVESLAIKYANILKLKPVSFKWKSSMASDYGYIAEDVAKILPELVIWENDDPNGVRYDRIALMLVEVVKKQQNKQRKHTSEINKLKKELAKIKNMLQEILK